MPYFSLDTNKKGRTLQRIMRPFLFDKFADCARCHNQSLGNNHRLTVTFHRHIGEHARISGTGHERDCAISKENSDSATVRRSQHCIVSGILLVAGSGPIGHASSDIVDSVDRVPQRNTISCDDH